MENSSTQNRKIILIRGLQMLVFGLLLNLGLTVISFLAFVQFFFGSSPQKKRTHLSQIWHLILRTGLVKRYNLCYQPVTINLFPGQKYNLNKFLNIKFLKFYQL